MALPLPFVQKPSDPSITGLLLAHELWASLHENGLPADGVDPSPLAIPSNSAIIGLVAPIYNCDIDNS